MEWKCFVNLTDGQVCGSASRHLIITHISYDPARPDAVIVAHPALVVWVLPPAQDVLVAQVVGPLKQNPGPTLHPDGIAAAEMGVELGTVAVALIITTLEVFIFIKHDLWRWTVS